MALVVAAPFALYRLWPEVLWVLSTQVASLVAVELKDFVHRARPSPELVRVFRPLDSPSFPSGHVVQYTVLFGFTLFLVYDLARRSLMRTSAIALLAAPIVLVGLSRMYLGQHWLSDVLGGYTVAAMMLIPWCWAYTKWRLAATRGRFISTGPRETKAM